LLCCQQKHPVATVFKIQPVKRYIKTTGTPIGLLIKNTDQRSKDYANIAETYRPGHADYVYDHKYGFRDYRGGGRSSARETAMRVAAGGIAKKYLKQQYGIEIRGYLSQLGPIKIEAIDWVAMDKSEFFCPDAKTFRRHLVSKICTFTIYAIKTIANFYTFNHVLTYNVIVSVIYTFNLVLTGIPLFVRPSTPRTITSLTCSPFY
jgi:hypothetical protein